MTARADPRDAAPAGRRGGREYVPALLVGLLVGLVLFATLPAPAPLPRMTAGAWDGPDQWSNGEMAAAMIPTGVGVMVSTVGSDEPYGLEASVAAVAETTAAGSTVATADLGTATWTVTNASVGPTFRMQYGATVPVVDAAGNPVGSTNVTVGFTASAAGSQAMASGRLVGLSISIGSWPWIDPHDLVGLSMPLLPRTAGLETLANASTPDTMDCVDTDSADVQEYFAWSSSATAVSGSGTPMSLGTNATIEGGPRAATVEIALEGSSGGYSAIRFNATVGLMPPEAVGGAPLAYALPLIAVAVAGAIVAAVHLERVRRRPPALLYVR
ncbi:MAG TPA: hypothetical protein VMH78_09010 [Thermoplasmata archaeon]|nr:hypothetical protein [Thermoplasmata archaeon]